MNINELKESWAELNQKGLKIQTENEIQRIIGYGTSDIVSNINKKLLVDMVVTSFASVVSALGIIFFYFVFDPLKHTWVDLSKIVPIQVMGFAIFLVLFLFGWFEYKLVNRTFTSESVNTHISALLVNLKNYERIFMCVVLTLLAVTFYIELSYFMVENMPLRLGGSALLTAISYVVMRRYYKKSFGSYLTDLVGYQKELSS